MKTPHKHEFLGTNGTPIELGLFRQEGDSAEESKALIEAGRILRLNPQLYGDDMGKLEALVQDVINGESEEGLIIETNDETASISINADTTTISRVEGGLWTVPSNRLLTMVQSLAQQENETT